MIVKRALLKSEIDKIKDFLHKMNLSWDDEILHSFYVEHNHEIIATGSRSHQVIKCLAADKNWQQLNLTNLLVDEITKSFNEDQIYHYYVATEVKNSEIFKSLGFSEIIRTDMVVLFEKGIDLIKDKLNQLKVQLENHLKTKLNNLDVGAIVINANPITLGHLKLIETAKSNHEILIIFLVEEDSSFFSYKERMSLLYLAVHHLHNVFILPSTEYLVSKMTFPSYFLKEKTSLTEYQTIIDTSIFNKYFIPIFNISKRYVGNETKSYMTSYNETLKNILKDKLELINRYQLNNEVISSSKVRELIKNNEIEKALEYMPKTTHALFKEIVRSKINGKNNF
ncbi:MAG: adenylyltransferase/cytidyltransferase family protein [Acholeplasmataceae bacterium]